MDKYNLLLKIKPPYIESSYITKLINKNDIVFTHKTLELHFDKEKKILKEKLSTSKKGGKILVY